MTPTDQQVEQLDARTTRAEALIRQLQGPVAARSVDALPPPGTAGDLVLFDGNVWIYNGTAWKQLAYA